MIIINDLQDFTKYVYFESFANYFMDWIVKNEQKKYKFKSICVNFFNN